MARLPRIVVPGIPHHVTQRGVRRGDVFFSDRDRGRYLGLLSSFCRKSGTEVWAYCLMPNHVHLIMVPSSGDGLRASLSEAHRRYTRSVNEREGCRGHLWQERFHSFPMDEHHLLAAVRYVELNPVRAKIVARPEAYAWSSAAAHLAGRDDGLVRVAPMLERVRDWREYLDSAPDDATVGMLRKHTNTGRPLGDESFLTELEREAGRPLRPKRRGRKRKRGN